MLEKLLNKLQFLSLFLVRFVCIFVSYSYLNKRIIFFMRNINDIIKPFLRTAGSSSLVVLGLLLSLSASAQGWEKYYGGDIQDEANAIVQTIDQGYAIVGNSNSFPGGFDIYVVRTDVDGTILWENNIGDPNTSDFGYDLVETSDGGIVVVGETNLGGGGGGKDVYLSKLNARGEQIWVTFFGDDTGDDVGRGINKTMDGGFIIVGESDDQIYVIKTDDGGNLEWETTLASAVPEVGHDIIETPGGDYILVGSSGENTASDVYVARLNNTGVFLQDYTFGGNENDVAFDIIRANDGTNEGDYVIAGKKGNNSDFYILRLNDTGANLDPVWAAEFGEPGISEEAKSIVQTKDGGFVIAGFSDFAGPEFLQASLLKIPGGGGSITWQKNYGREGLDAANDLVMTATGGFLLAGFTSENLFDFFDVLAIKTDEEGELAFNTHIQGKVYYDFLDDCTYDGNEEGVKNWVVKAVGDKTYYGVTDEEGNYDITVDLGQYELSIVTPNKYWNTCPVNFNVNFPEPYDTLTRNFAVSPIISCEDLEVDVSTPFVKACEQTTYTINYCNHGTIEAEDIEVGLILSNNLTYISGPTISTIDDSLYVFDRTDLDIGECGSFEIVVEASCDALLAETHSIKANITPDNICLPDDPAWDGSSIAVNGYCDGDSVRFQIRNVGAAAMSQSLDYIVVEDIVMGLQGDPNPPTLDPGQIFEFAIKANGATQRLIAKQSTGHPGNSISPTIAIEGCVDGGGTDYSTGYHTQFPEDDADHFLATDCQENIPSSFDSQVKRGYPKGYGDSLKIANTTDLKYHIKFQNVGTDTAIRMVIRDTISPFLDPQFVRPGASSHDYEFEVYDNGILKFTFNDILLPDSSTNEAASHGFVKYRITQKPDNPIGSFIKNGAAIFFDYNAPLYTDSVCNVVAGMEWAEFIITSDHEIYIPQTEIKIYPNPVLQFATFELESPLIHPPLDFEVYDVAGKLVRSERFYETKFIFNRGELSAGMYFYRISSENQLISTGKIITTSK